MWKRIIAVLCAISLLPLSLPAQLPEPPQGYVYITIEELMLMLNLSGISTISMADSLERIESLKDSSESKTDLLQSSNEILDNSETTISNLEQSTTNMQNVNDEIESISDSLSQISEEISNETDNLKPSFWTSPAGITLIVLISAGLGYAGGRLHEHLRSR